MGRDKGLLPVPAGGTFLSRLTRALVEGGCDDVGGTLMEETISRMAGSQHGSRKSVAELEALAAAAGRPARQRTTTYGEVPAERLAAARRVALPLESVTLRAH